MTMKATCYLRLEPKVRKGRVRGFKVASVTQGRPHVAETPGTRLVKLTVKVPDDAFDATEATMEVPAEFLEAPVTFDAEDAKPAPQDSPTKPKDPGRDVA